MLTNKEIYENSAYHNTRTLISDFNDIKRIAESDIRDILIIKKSPISITPMWVEFYSCGTHILIDTIYLDGVNVLLRGTFPSGGEAIKHFTEIWDIHNFADICKEIGV